MLPDGACRATRKDGRPCGSVIVLDSGFCPMHDPDRQGVVAAGRAKGGHSKATSARLDQLLPATLRPMIATLLGALTEVHEGTLDPKQASAMASLASAIVRAYNIGILEQRVEALERQQEGATA